MLTWLDSLVAQLLRFVWHTVLPAVPRALWWVLGGMLFACFNLIFEHEVWAHTPQAEPVFACVLCAGLTTLPWLGAITARRVGRQVVGWGWCSLWQLVTGVCYFAVFISLIVAGVAVVLLLI